MSDKSTLPVFRETVPNTNMNNLAVGGFGVMIASSLCVFLFLPFLLPFAPVLLILGGMMAWALVSGEKAKRKAQKIAASRLGGRATKLSVVDAGNDGILNSGELVINDWGVVYAKSGSPTFEAAWNEITMADEPNPAVLRINTAKTFMQMEPQRWSLVSSILFDQLPGRTNFDFNPHTLQSYILPKLERAPRQWPKHKFSIDRQGFSLKGQRYNFDSIEWIEERVQQTEDGSFVYWKIKCAGSKEFDFHDPGDGAMSMLKIILGETIPGRMKWVNQPRTAADRICDEFGWWWEVLQAALKVAKDSGKYNSKIGRHLEYMKWMGEKYDCISRYRLEKVMEHYEVYRSSQAA